MTGGFLFGDCAIQCVGRLYKRRVHLYRVLCHADTGHIFARKPSRQIAWHIDKTPTVFLQHFYITCAHTNLFDCAARYKLVHYKVSPISHDNRTVFKFLAKYIRQNFRRFLCKSNNNHF